MLVTGRASSSAFLFRNLLDNIANIYVISWHSLFFKMHPLIKILNFILILALMNYLNGRWLGALSGLIVIMAMTVQLKVFFNIIKRMRWLFMSILLIYAFTTPGEYVQNVPIGFSPTIEGIELGLLQLMRLLVALAALTLLYADSTKEQLILGLYLLLKPLSYLGLDVERFAVRLSLTLQYVEDFAMRKDTPVFSFEHFRAMMLAGDVLPGSGSVTFKVMPFKLIDKLLAGVLMLIFLGLLIFECLGVRFAS